jgi:N-methylhydantoinase B
MVAGMDFNGFMAFSPKIRYMNSCIALHCSGDDYTAVTSGFHLARADMSVNAIDLSLFVSRLQSICAEMGAILQYSACSPNIRDRLDFSCAIFDSNGELCAQAAHIPVHLGSMAYAMRDIADRFDWQDGDMLILNDPYLGGTHLPDITLLAPVFFDGQLQAFTANRAHHADVGAMSPGSMPLSRSLDEEGVLITPRLLYKNHHFIDTAVEGLYRSVHRPSLTRADLSAQISSVRKGAGLLQTLIMALGSGRYAALLAVLNQYAERFAQTGLREIPDGTYTCADVMDDDGLGNTAIPIVVTLHVDHGRVRVDFAGTADQVAGNINCPLSVTAAAVYYCFYCLMPEQTPACAGTFRPIGIQAPAGCLVNSTYPAAVAAGNVETSTRIVDVTLGALANAIPHRIPAASHGSMNNLALGANDWDYYETIGGGMGAGPATDGLPAVQTHMTNTLNTPVEILEMQYPLCIRRHAVRRGSGGAGQYRGGDGLIREYAFLADTTVTLLSERRSRAPWGLQGGAPGKTGLNLYNGKPLSGKFNLQAKAGDVLTIETAGGGGWGTSPT